MNTSLPIPITVTTTTIPQGVSMQKTIDLDTLTAKPETFAPRSRGVDYAKTKPGAVSSNLHRLMTEANMKISQLAKASNVGDTTVRRFINNYEPPTNHPSLHAMAKALAVRLRRPQVRILEELLKGGAPLQFTMSQWMRINGDIGSTHRNTPTRKVKAKTTTPAPFIPRKPSLEPSAVSKRVVARRKAAASNGAGSDLRTLVTTLNMNRMQGEKFVTVPIDQLSDLVATALKASGRNPDEMLIRADFVDSF